MNQLLEAFERGEPRTMATSLVIASILLYVVGANIAWYYRVSPGGRLARRIRLLAASNPARALYEIFRLIYYVGVPYAALYLGWVDVRAMGLGFLDWATGLRWTIVLALATWSLLMFVWVPYLRATATMPAKFDLKSLTWSRRVVEVVYMQAHWAFYRAACILLLASVVADDVAVYWGTSAGIALSFLEAWADPRLRRHMAQFGEGELALWSTGQAVVNAVGFILTRNVWLLALIHLALEFTVPHLRAAPRPPLPPKHVARVKTSGPRQGLR